MDDDVLTDEEKRMLLQNIKSGILHDSLDKYRKMLKSKIDDFIESGFSTSIFLTGHPGSGKSFIVNDVIESMKEKNLWSVFIDCRIFNSDKLACREFLRQTGNLVSTPVLEVLREKGSGIIIFDHFDSLKIIKRQFFLYTLFDSIHNNTISLCCILNTSSVEPLTNLEKRVRSRLTPQILEMPKPTLKDAYSLSKMLLTFDDAKDKKHKKWNAYIASSFNYNTAKDCVSEGGDHQLKEVFDISPSYHTVINFLNKFVLNDVRETISAELFDNISVSKFLGCLSQTELSVLFTAAFMMDVRGTYDFTFDTLYTSLSEQFITHGFIKTISKQSAQLAWQKLINLNFLVPTPKDKTKYSFNLFSQDLAEFLYMLPTDMEQWVKSWIHA